MRYLCIAALVLLFVSPTPASAANPLESCSAGQALSNCEELCKTNDRMMVGLSDMAFDCHYDLRRSEWLTTWRKAWRRLELLEGEPRMEPKEWLTARTVLRREFEQENESGNAAAGVMVGLIGLWETPHFTGQKQRSEILRVASALARSADIGSLTALHTLTAFFSASDIWARHIPPGVVACWKAANRTMIALREHLASVPADDPHLWAGRACIAPTLEALRH